MRRLLRIARAMFLALVVGIAGDAFGLSVEAAASAQTPAAQPAPAAPAAASDRLRVYIDCFDCFRDFLREQIAWVDFVRQVQDADVTLLANSTETGGGGREVVLRFIGRGRFAGQDRELKAISLPGETENVRRANVLRTVVVGLLGYLAADRGLPAGLDLEIDMDAPPAAAGPVADPWKLWVFSVSAGGSFSAEESNRESRWNLSVSGDRVTEDWKISFGARAENENERFDLDEDAPFEVRQRERSADWFFAKSWGPHWSIGVDGGVESSTFGNRRFSARSAPAIEFSVFPYRDYATRQFVFQYEAGVEYAKYNELTLFDKLRETLFRHEFSARLDQRQPWGSLEAGVELSQYLHDLGKYRVEVNGELDLRIARGLTLSVEGNASRIRDQISLPRRDATPEEVLLRLRQLQSGYEVGVSFSIRYSFGSIFNNVVNPRFGG